MRPQSGRFILMSFVALFLLPTTAQSQQPKPGGTLKIAFESDVPGMDSHISLGVQVLIPNLFNTLVTITESLDVIPDLARSWEVKNGGEADIAYAMMGSMAEEVKRDPKLKLAYSYGPGIFFIDFTEQWDPQSPWHDLRVRQALNEEQTLGASYPTQNIVPRAFELALPLEAYPYNPEKAKQLLKE